MPNDKLKLYYKTLEDIWNYRADLTTQQKATIAPFQDMFGYRHTKKTEKSRYTLHLYTRSF